jgi:hypothetical protein
MSLRSFLVVAAATVLLSPARVASAQNSPLTQAQKQFVERYVEAIRAKDVSREKALIHPKSLACITPENAVYFDEIFAMRRRHRVDAIQRASAQVVPSGERLFLEDEVVYPVRPSHWLQIDLASGAASSTTLLIQVVADHGAWFEVIPCPTPATVVKVREKKLRDEQNDQRARALLPMLKDPLLSELKEMIAHGRKATAIMRYSKESGETTGVAARVIDLIEESKQ